MTETPFSSQIFDGYPSKNRHKILLRNFFSVTKFINDQYCDDENFVTNPSLNMICDGIVMEISVTILVFSCNG